ncbi:hypothetical protein RF11_03974 [Thelohanellus kitauei]|uniref:Uncharacterized protein n=1 Tax=Thelohanellus kitauei TaxID=669202 RepID=A0A0C2MFW9_THEKT|nr:hypothetical protein RF11_03974 [Thelohanellus kitauei]
MIETPINNNVSATESASTDSQLAEVRNLPRYDKKSENVCISGFSRNTKEELKDNKESEAVEKLPFPWFKNRKVKIEKSILNDMFPFTEADVLSKSVPALDFVFSKYDWALENERSAPSCPKPKPSSVQSNLSRYIPHTTVRRENAFSLRYHLRSLVIIILYIALIIALGKKFITAVKLIFSIYFR